MRANPISRAVARWTAARYDATLDALVDLSGNGHNAVLGSSVGADSNDPTRLTHDGKNYVWFQDSGSNVVNVTGLSVSPAKEVIIRWECSLDDLTPSGNRRVWDCRSTDGEQPSLWFLTSGKFGYRWEDGASVAKAADTTVTLASLGLAADTDYLFEVRHEGVDTTSPDITFWYSADGGTTWTKIGDTVNPAGVTAGWAAATTQFRVGSDLGSYHNGRLSQFQIWFDGVEYARLVPDDIVPWSTALDLNGGTDYASTPDAPGVSPTGDLDITLDFATNDWSPAGGWKYIIDKYGIGTTNNSFRVYLTNLGRFVLDATPDGTDAGRTRYIGTKSLTVRPGARHTFRFTLDIDDGAGNSHFRIYIDGHLFETVTVATTLAQVHDSTQPLLVGARSIGEGPPDMRLFAFSLRDGIDGTITANVDFTTLSPGDSTVTGTTGETWTFNSNAAAIPDGQLRIYDSTPTYLDLPGAFGDNAVVPFNSVFVGASTIEWIAYVQLDDWSPSPEQVISAGDADAGRWFSAYISPAGRLVTVIWTGSAWIGQQSTSGFNATGEALWLRVVIDIDGESATQYQSTDPINTPRSDISWSPLAIASENWSGVVVNPSASNDLRIGDKRSGSEAVLAGFVGYLYMAADGSDVYDIDFTDLAPGVTEFTEDSDNAATVTVNGNAAIAGGSNKWDVNRASSGLVTTLVDQPMFALDGTDDYFEGPDNFEADGDLSAIVLWRNHWAPNEFDVLIGKRRGTSSSLSGWNLTVGSNDNTKAEIADGATEASDETVDGSLPRSRMNATAMVLDSGSTITLFDNGVSSGGQATALTGTSAEPLVIGAAGNPSWAAMGMEFYAAAIWNRALTDDDIATVSEWLRTRFTFGVSETELARTGEAQGVTRKMVEARGGVAGDYVGNLNWLAGTVGLGKIGALEQIALDLGITPTTSGEIGLLNELVGVTDRSSADYIGGKVGALKAWARSGRF